MSAVTWLRALAATLVIASLTGSCGDETAIDEPSSAGSAEGCVRHESSDTPYSRSSIQEIFDAADVAVIGTVISTRPQQLGPDAARLDDVHTIRVERVLKGEVTDTTVEVALPGTQDGCRIDVEGLARPEEDQRALWLVTPVTGLDDYTGYRRLAEAAVVPEGDGRIAMVGREPAAVEARAAGTLEALAAQLLATSER